MINTHNIEFISPQPTRGDFKMLIRRRGLSLSAGQEPYSSLIGQPTGDYLPVGEILVSASLTKVPEQSIEQKCLGEVPSKSAWAKYRTQGVE